MIHNIGPRKLARQTYIDIERQKVEEDNVLMFFYTYSCLLFAGSQHTQLFLKIKKKKRKTDMRL